MGADAGGLEELKIGAVTSAAHLLSAPSAGALAAEPVGLDAMAFWLYTSGTTGAPKAAVHGHRTLFACRHYGAEVLSVAAAIESSRPRSSSSPTRSATRS